MRVEEGFFVEIELEEEEERKKRVEGRRRI